MPKNTHLTRRHFLYSGVAIAGLALPVIGFAATHSGISHKNPLAIPPLDPGEVSDGRRVFNLKLQYGSHEFFAGTQTPTKGINGNYLGPVLRMHKGEVVRLNVTNGLDEDSTLHWHGFNLPASADGGPHQVVTPGQTWSPEFEVHAVASTMWYHSHQMSKTAPQVWAGLAGMVIIDDDAAGMLALPSQYGIDDIPLVLQDRRFSRRGGMPYRTSMHDRMVGMIGDYPVLNGTTSPYLEVSHQKVRLRLLNGSNASIYNLAFRDKRSFQVIASDGGLLASPVSLTKLRLSPGERAEIVVSFEPGQAALLESVAEGHGEGMSGGMEGMGGMGGGGMMTAAQSPVFELLEFRPADNLIASSAVPDQLANLAAPEEKTAEKTRHFVLEMPEMGMRMMLGGKFTINGNKMNIARIDEVVKVGEAEIWEIENPSQMAHPFHVHNTQFRVLDQNGSPPAPHKAGLKDTVLVEAGEVVRILVRFDHYTDPDLPYMYHCHILEHEDAGMMGQFTVV